MSWSDYKKSLGSVFEDRISSPLYGTVIISWILWNWKIIYLTIFVSQDNILPKNKIDFILENYSKVEFLVIYPLISAAVLILGIPWLANKALQVSLWYEKDRDKMKEKLIATKRLSITESAKIRNENARLIEEHMEQMNQKENDVTILKQQVKQLTEERNKFTILRAVYGNEDSFLDVTDVLGQNFQNANSIDVTNESLGGVDPLPFKHKKLFITYGFNGNARQLIVKEYYKVNKNAVNSTLYHEETDQSKKAYLTENLNKLFPGIWSMFDPSRNYQEEFQILAGSQYGIMREGVYVPTYNISDLSIEDKNNINFKKTPIGSDVGINSIPVTMRTLVWQKEYEGTSGTSPILKFEKVTDE